MLLHDNKSVTTSNEGDTGKQNGIKAQRSHIVPVTKPLQVHHFATNKSKKYTSQFKNIIGKYMLDLDGDWNKQLMPHQGRHPNAYHDYVLDAMQKIDMMAGGDCDKFLKLFGQIKKTIVDNPDMLYKDYWSKK